MKQINKIKWISGALLSFCFLFACQEFDRPDMVVIPDPEPGPYSPLKMYFPFENGSVADSSIYGFQTFPTNVTFTDGYIGKAMQCKDGSYFLIDSPAIEENNVDMMDSICNLPDGFTIAFWTYVKKNQVGNGACGIFAVADSLDDWKGNLDIFTDAVSGESVTIKMHMKNYRNAVGDIWIGDNAVVSNIFDKWTHLVFRYSAKSSRITYFRDNEVVYEQNVTGGDLQFKNVSGIVLGTFQNLTNPSLAKKGYTKETWQRSYGGIIDEFRFYNRYLTTFEIDELYNSKEQ